MVVSWIERVASAMVFVLIPMVMMMIITALRFMSLTTWANGIAPAENQAFYRRQDGTRCYFVMVLQSLFIYFD